MEKGRLIRKECETKKGRDRKSQYMMMLQSVAAGAVDETRVDKGLDQAAAQHTAQDEIGG